MVWPNVLCLLLWLLAVVYVYAVSKDALSPPMLYLGVGGLFFSNLFFYDHNLLVSCVYILVLTAIVAAAYFLTPKRGATPAVRCNESCFDEEVLDRFNKITVGIYTLSLAAIMAELYLVNSFGGIIPYIIAAKYSTREFYGLGVLKTLISTIYPLNLLYFAFFLLARNRLSGNQRMAFYVHLIITMLIAISTLSRGTLLTHILYMVFLRHYIVRKVTLPYLAAVFLSALVAAGIYGVARERFSLGDDSFSFGISQSEEKIKTEWMEFGTLPLEKILESGVTYPALGATYITAITNFVPRALWADKPKPGGVVFTETYVPGMYDEYSHYTTGIFPEAMINFGIFPGIIFGTLQLFLMCYAITLYYRNNISRRAPAFSKYADAPKAVLYVYCLYSFPIYLTGEFTSVTVGLVIKASVVVGAVVYLRLRIHGGRHAQVPIRMPFTPTG